MDYQDHVKTQFSQEELLQIASSLSLPVTSEIEIHVLIDWIRTTILEQGASPSALMDEFIKVIRLYDDDTFTLVKPTCYGFALDFDHNCHYCLAYVKCGETLVENLPDCFGILYDINDWNCGRCMVRQYCNVNLPKIDEIEGTYEVYLPQDMPLLGNILTFLARYRSVRYNWPEEVTTRKYGRFRNFTIKGLRWGESLYQVLRDAVYFGGPYGEKPTEREPVIFDEKREPVYREGQFPIRLVWEFKDE